MQTVYIIDGAQSWRMSAILQFDMPRYVYTLLSAHNQLVRVFSDNHRQIIFVKSM
jgi:hypothetical protein